MAFRRGLIRIRSSICNTSDARNDVLENNAAQHKEYQHRITVDHWARSDDERSIEEARRVSGCSRMPFDRPGGCPREYFVLAYKRPTSVGP